MLFRPKKRGIFPPFKKSILEQFIIRYIYNLVYPYKKYPYFQVYGRIEQLRTGPVDISTYFTCVEPELESYLQRTKRGEIKGYMQPLFVSEVLPMTLKVGGVFLKSYTQAHIPLEGPLLEALLSGGKVSFSFIMPESQHFLYRDHPRGPLTSRVDQVTHNGISLKLPKKSSLLIYYCFESLQGKPLVVFL